MCDLDYVSDEVVHKLAAEADALPGVTEDKKFGFTLSDGALNNKHGLGRL
jgi:hypothetical protein